MKEMWKRLFAIVLAALMLCGTLPMSVFAASNPYQNYKNAKDPDGHWANCTYWAWQCAYEATGIALPTFGDAR